MILTATSLVFDFDNRTFLPPINRFRQFVADKRSVTVAPGLSDPPLGIDPGTQVLGSVLLVGDIGESVQPDLVGPILSVVLIDEPEIVLEDLEPPLLLAQSIVGLAMLLKPLLVDGHDLVVGSPRGLVGMGLVVGDDGHVQGRRHGEDHEQKRDHGARRSRRTHFAVRDL